MLSLLEEAPARSVSWLLAGLHHRFRSFEIVPAAVGGLGRWAPFTEHRHVSKDPRKVDSGFGPRSCSKERTRDYMATATAAAPRAEDFAAMSRVVHAGRPARGSVVKASSSGSRGSRRLDVGAKTEARVALREFSGPGAAARSRIGDEVEVYLERVENALGEFRSLARSRGAPRKRAGAVREGLHNNEKVQASSSIRSRAASRSTSTARWRSCRAHQVDNPADPRRHAADERQSTVPDPKMVRRRGNIVVSRRTVLEETRAEQRQGWCRTSKRQVIDGVVRTSPTTARFVDLGGIDGLQHVTISRGAASITRPSASTSASR